MLPLGNLYKILENCIRYLFNYRESNFKEVTNLDINIKTININQFTSQRLKLL